jgi:hypothetical protein
MVENMKAAGYEPWMYDAAEKAPGGAYARPVHPSTAIKASRFPASQMGFIDDK